MNLIILSERDRSRDHAFILSDHRAEHIREILKRKAGDTVEIGLLNGPQGTARIEEVTAESVRLHCDAWRETAAPSFEIDLICALPRPQTLKKVLVTSAMMGVRSLHLLRANRVERSYFQSPLINAENQQPYLIEGLAQGKLTRLPVVQVHDRFRSFIEDELDVRLGDSSLVLRLLCSLESHDCLNTVLTGDMRSAVVAVGPEGGWVPFEIELMQAHGFRPFTLGGRTLRVEHAVTAALAQIELIRMMRPGASSA